jgi:hypothetical protein
LAADRRVRAREATRVSGLGLDSVDSAEIIEQLVLQLHFVILPALSLVVAVACWLLVAVA